MIYYFFCFLFGLIAGSFLNVLIPRFSKGESPWRPLFSYCPHCKKPIKATDNIPILSYLMLQGRCRFCRAKIPLIYLVTELSCGLLLCLTFWRLQTFYSGAGMLFWREPAIWTQMIAFSIFSLTLTAIAVIDWQTRTIPDVLNLGLAGLMLIFAPLNPLLEYNPGILGAKWIKAAGGALAGGGAFLLLAILGEKIYKKEALGGGDVKLAAAIGAALGAHGIFALMVLSSFLGLCFSLPQLIKGSLGRKDPIAFGPFMALAAFLIFLFQDHLPCLWKNLIFPLSHCN